MKCLIMALIAIGLSASHAFCAETVVASKIDAVEIHPDSAEITRIAHCSLKAGDTSILVNGLSSELQAQSIRVSGLGTNGVSIRSVSTHVEIRKVDVAPSSREQALIDEEQDLRGRLEALNVKAHMIRRVAEAQPDLSIGAPGSSTAAPEFWSSIWTKVADGLEDTDRRRRETQKRLDVVTAALVAMRASHQTSNPPTQTLSVVIDVSVDHAVEADIKLVYQVSSAHWQGFYDARLRTDRQPAQLDLMRRAKITQTSGEDWTDVTLTLSTTRLSAETVAPTLDETGDVIGNSPRSPDAAVMLMTPSALGPLRYDFAKAVSLSGPLNPTSYDASLQIPGRVTIASDPMFKVYNIGLRTMDVDLSVKSAPVADTHAYLQAKFDSNDRVPLIPGEVELYRDGTFIGQTTLKGAIQGDHVAMGFGMDDLVSVERSDIARKERNTTIRTGIASVERTFKTVVTNRHPFPIQVEIDDREPAFNNVAIVLRELPNMTPPTNRQVDGHRGVLAWTSLYAPGETRTITLAWHVQWPAKLGPIQGSTPTQIFRFSGGATF